MIRGVIIFTAGVGVGYAAAVKNQQATDDFFHALKPIVTDAWLDMKNEMAAANARKAESAEEAKKSTPFCPHCGAPEKPEGGKDHAIGCPINQQPETPINSTQGENPS